MEIVKSTVNASPFLGVFCVATDDVLLLPNRIEAKELKNFEILDTEIINVSVASSSLIGVFVAGLGNKFALPYFAEKTEIKKFEENNLEVIALNSSALGNLVALNRNGGIASPLIGKKVVDKMQDFFGVEFLQKQVAGFDLPGAALTVTNKGFIVHPNIGKDEFSELEKFFKVNGSITTLNYGDPFVGNDIVANSNAAVVGANTSGHELIRVDEGLRGE
ncbi:MAG: translation initiation factor IF-6 [Candidatus Diapherotrites archaeon]